jgi:DNA-binding response OmpR family regulator
MAHETVLAGYSVLVVEDDFYLADDLRQTLEDAGATVLGPARNAADALKVTGQTRPDGAVVDVNLGTGPTFEIPRALRGLGVPFILATGYDASVISPEFADAPRLEKPVDPRRLVAAVAELRQARP